MSKTTMTQSTAFAMPTFDAPGHWRRSGLLAALVGVVFGAILGWMVWDRITLLKQGREIVLPVVPVDPRSLFRGDYVILNFDVSNVPSPVVAPGEARRPHRARPLYATLEQGADGAWKAIATSRVHPGAMAANRVVLQGRPKHHFLFGANGGRVQLRYGIESYFVPEGKGRDLENLVRDKKIAVRVAVDAKGRAAIKGLIVDGQPVYEEPLL